MFSLESPDRKTSLRVRDPERILIEFHFLFRKLFFRLPLFDPLPKINSIYFLSCNYYSLKGIIQSISTERTSDINFYCNLRKQVRDKFPKRERRSLRVLREYFFIEWWLLQIFVTWLQSNSTLRPFISITKSEVWFQMKFSQDMFYQPIFMSILRSSSLDWKNIWFCRLIEDEMRIWCSELKIFELLFYRSLKFIRFQNFFREPKDDFRLYEIKKNDLKKKSPKRSDKKGPFLMLSKLVLHFLPANKQQTLATFKNKIWAMWSVVIWDVSFFLRQTLWWAIEREVHLILKMQSSWVPHLKELR